MTISVDDGHPADFRTAELLQKHQLKATFYTPRHNLERTVISEREIAEIGRFHEVGGHTVNNLRLHRLPRRMAWKEISDCKHWLQDVTGNEVTSFCYPGGKFDARTVELVKQAGYLGARTCMFNLHRFPRDPFRLGVSTHACAHSNIIQIRHALLESNLRGAWNYLTVYRRTVDWKKQFLLCLDMVERQGGIAHLFLHSWEIDDHGDWLTLEDLFRNIAERKTLVPITNGELFRACRNQLRPAPAA